ncbi:putative Ankyrin repeat-containing protein YAR1 (putative) [Pseudozyma hubeiensis]|nr:putative Ankyrin repeat-containing protein YAR1 (putative) [Pseudozyma hubeiensis]
MSNKAASLTSDQIDELLLSARYGDLEDLQASLSPLLSTSSPSSPSELLATIKNEDSNTLLHYASANGHLEVVQYLLPFSDLSLSLAQNVSGNTPLHWAGLNGHLDTVKLLVSHISKLESEHPEEAKKLNLIFHPKTPSKPDAAEGEKTMDPRESCGT